MPLLTAYLSYHRVVYLIDIYCLSLSKLRQRASWRRKLFHFVSWELIKGPGQHIPKAENDEPRHSCKDAPERGILNLAGEDQHSFSGDGSFERVSRCLFLGRKAMTNLDSILKSRDITLPAKIHIVKAMVFPVVMYGCESWNKEV